MSKLSCGPWTYNRFNQYEELLEGKKPDFLDKDKDGDKKESFKKAVSDKKKECKDCGKEDCKCEKGKERAEKKEKSLPPWLKDKKDVKEAVMKAIMDGGMANNPVSAEVIAEHMSEDWKNHILQLLD